MNSTSNFHSTTLGYNTSTTMQDNSVFPFVYSTVRGQYPYMSDSGGGGASAGIFIGAGVGGCALIVGVIALVIYCYMKARKEKANTNMTKSQPDVFSTAASNTQFDFPQRSRVNQYPDPEAARRSKRRERGRDSGHSNPAFRHGSDSSSIGSDAEGRDLSPPRVRRPRGGQANDAFSSESSYEDSSSVDDEVVGGNYTMERETDRDRKPRGSYKRATGKQDDYLDGSRNKSNGRYRRTEDESQRMSRRDEYSKRNPRSDSPLTIETLEKHEKTLARRESKEWEDQKAFRNNKSRKREPSPSSRTYESSEVTQASLTTEGTEYTATTMSSTRFQKNPSLRRNSPSRSSSHRRYRKDHETDEKGRRKPRRTRSSERERSERHDRRNHDRSRSPGSASSRSGSGSTRRSRTSSAREAKKLNKEQAILPIFADAGKKKSSAV